MITSRMTPQEKLLQMERLHPYVKAIAQRTMNENTRLFKKAARFPSFVFLREREIADFGRWTVVLVCDSRANAIMGRFTFNAFQTFEVRHARKEYNNGTGIYVFHPQNQDDVWCIEYPPHYFFRLRERYISQKGIVQPDFTGLVKELLRIHHHSMNVILQGTVIEKGEDGMYDIIESPKNQRQKGYDNCASYHKEGISLGVSIDCRYFHFTTFVCNNLLKCSQAEMQKRQVADARNHDLRLRYDHKSVLKEREYVDGEVNFGL